MSDLDEPPPPDQELLHAAIDLLMQGHAAPEAELAHRFPDLVDALPAAMARARRYFARVRPSLAAGDQREAGAVLGDFELVELLGAGSMGRVHRARQRSLGGREVALKLLPTELADEDPRFAERFRREAALAATVHHPNVAEVHGSGEHGGQLYFARRLVEGPTLAQVIGGIAERRRRGDASSSTTDYARRAVIVVRDLAGALAAIHAKGLVHRDVKPSNIVMEGARVADERALEGRPILLDFGLLRPIEGSDVTLTRGLGTLAYAAPEALLGEALDASADVFGLGALLHDLLAVTRPGERSQAAAGLADLRGLNHGVDARLAAIVAMATDKRRSIRYADGEAFREELDHYLAGEPIRALPASPLARASLWVRREPARALRLVGAVTLLAPVLLGVGWFGGEARATYELARSAAEAVEGGDLHLGRRRSKELLESTLIRWLPGLGEEVSFAETLERELGALLDQLSGTNASDLRLGHAELQQRLLTPGEISAAWEARYLAFLARELRESGRPLRQLAAAESLMAYFIVHPRPAGWSSGDATGIAVSPQGPHAAGPDFDDVLGALIETASRIGGSRDVRSHAIAALANMPCDDALEVLAELAGEEALRDIAFAAGAQATWLAWRQDRCAALSPDVLVRWTRSVFRNRPPLYGPKGQPFGHGVALKGLLVAAMVDRVLGGAISEQLLERLSRAERSHFLSLGALLAQSPGAAPELPELPAPLILEDEWSRLPQWLDGTFGEERDQWFYENIWAKAEGWTYPVVERLERAPRRTWQAGSDFRAGVARLHGAARELRWRGAGVLHDATGDYLQLGAVGTSAVRFSFDVPREHATSPLAVTIAHGRASRSYLPGQGRTWIRMSLEGGRIVHEGEGPPAPSAQSFSITPDERVGREELELVVELLSGSTTHRIYWIDVTLGPEVSPDAGPSQARNWYGDRVHQAEVAPVAPEGVEADPRRGQ